MFLMVVTAIFFVGANYAAHFAPRDNAHSVRTLRQWPPNLVVLFKNNFILPTKYAKKALLALVAGAYCGDREICNQRPSFLRCLSSSSRWALVFFPKTSTQHRNFHQCPERGLCTRPPQRVSHSSWPVTAGRRVPIFHCQRLPGRSLLLLED
jgi:hypothetical protein